MNPASAGRAAVLGSPVGHSLSPVLHRAGYAAAGLTDWTYAAIDCDAAGLPGLVAGSDPDFVGYSVTMPGKAAAAAFADTVTERVDLLGVANTLFRSAGGWRADNTDIDGVRGALAAAGIHEVDRVLLLGGGHTARAVVAALVEMGVGGLTIAGRRSAGIAEAANLARTLGISTDEIDLSLEAVGAAAVGAELIVSSIPADGAQHLAGLLSDVPVLLDVIYYPWPTPLAAGSRPGRITVTGLDMLLHQGFRQFEIFTGLPAPRVQMRDALRAAAKVELPLAV